ncbi:unnamed protein product [Nesidiocoris tenuis]|uniref:Reverse transcriptase domain-containing protein n=1 Tax=Nesidiocoris tenuis TaxID=355587 RepID=A0A6H5G239_9HEMI|nr:unnamed protein product [Nesidiocoris tenuis]CAA9995958.1 unnamed protein product [Nesidiocoris tenuis]
MTESFAEMKKALRILWDYCAVNELVVNAEKSKVLVFQKGGRQKKYNFPYGTEQLEVVKSASFLGVEFSSSGLFTRQAKLAVKKGIAAYKSVWPIIFRSQANTPSTWKTLFSAVIASTALYAAEAWGFCHGELLERVQVRAYKSLLGLGWNTPDYLVRAELGLTHLKLQIGKRMFGWFVKIQGMGNERLPKICFNRLLELETSLADPRYNWVLQFRQLLAQAGCEGLLEPQDCARLKQQRELLEGRLERALRLEDVEGAARSSFNRVPRNGGSREGKCCPYLVAALPLYAKRLLAQTRLAGRHFCRVYLNKLCIKFTADRTCQVCDMPRPDTLEHLIAECAVFRAERRRFLGGCTLSEGQLTLAMTAASPASLIGFLQTALRLRAFVVSEGAVF